MKIIKPFLSIVLAIVLAVSLNFAAFAVPQETLIGTPDQLKQFISDINSGSTFKDATVKLTADIDMQGVDWVMAGNRIDESFIGFSKDYGSNYFDGTFDGQNFAIKNLNGSAPGGNPDNPDIVGDNIMGLFACLGENGTIKSLKIENADIKGRNTVSALVALNMGTIDNCGIYNSKLTSKEYSGSREDVYFDPARSGTGGIAGMSSGIIKNCRVDGLTIERGGAVLGGIVGLSLGTVDGCVCSNLSFNDYVIPHGEFVRWETIGDEGGIVGCSQQNEYVLGSQPALIKNCVNYSDLVGLRSVGGICGFLNNASIVDCKNYGDVIYTALLDPVATDEEDVDGQWFGGICGSFCATSSDCDTKVIHCYNSGNVSGHLRVGGIAGSGDNMAGGFAPDPSQESIMLIEKCFNSGDVYATRNQVGGICGKTDAPVYGCFNTGDVSLHVSKDFKSDMYAIGGIAGVLNDYLEECGNSGDVYFEKNVEFETQPAFLIGGIVGFSLNSHAWSSYSIGSVSTNIPEENWEEEVVHLGGVAGAIPYTLSQNNYFTCDDTMAKREIGNYAESGGGISLEKMRSLGAKESMPGIFEGKNGYFTVVEDYYADDILYATYPFIESAFMDKTTLAVAIGHAPEKPEEKPEEKSEEKQQTEQSGISGNGNPDTGDHSNIPLFVFLTLISAFAATVVTFKTRKL